MSDQVQEKKTRGRPRTQKTVAESNGVIGAPEPVQKAKPVSNLGPYLAQKTIVSGAAIEQPKQAEPAREPSTKVALLSTRNLSWSEVGKLTIGYNLVSRGDSEKWLTMRGVRIATPEEVATHYGK